MGNCNCGRSQNSSKKDATILTEEEIRLLLSNTKLNRDQINALHNNFLEECPNGRMTRKEFLRLFKKVHQSDNKKEKADKFCDYVFKVIDSDNIGYITFKDFVLCLSLTSYGDFRQKCEFAFRLYDLDRDGKISKKEMTQVLEALYDLSGIVDRKGDRSPAKKVEEILSKLNASSVNTDDSAPKKSKSKIQEYITQDQFIDGCCKDRTIKNLFIDSIFAKSNHEDEKNLNNCGSLVGDKPKLCFLCIFKVAPLKAPDYNVSDIKKPETKSRSSVSQVEKPTAISHLQATPEYGPKVESEKKEIQIADNYNKSLLLNSSNVSYRESFLENYLLAQPSANQYDNTDKNLIRDSAHSYDGYFENNIRSEVNYVQPRLEDYQLEEKDIVIREISPVQTVNYQQKDFLITGVSSDDKIVLLLDEKETFEFVDKYISETNYKLHDYNLQDYTIQPVNEEPLDDVTTHNIDITLSTNVESLKEQINQNDLSDAEKQLIHEFIIDVSQKNRYELNGKVITETATTSFFEPATGDQVKINDMSTQVYIDIKLPETGDSLDPIDSPVQFEPKKLVENSNDDELFFVIDQNQLTEQERKNIQNLFEETSDLEEIEQELNSILEKIETRSELESNSFDPISQAHVISTEDNVPLTKVVLESKQENEPNKNFETNNTENNSNASQQIELVDLSQTVKVAEEEIMGKKNELSISNESSPVIEPISNLTLADASAVNESDSKLNKSATLPDEESKEESTGISPDIKVSSQAVEAHDSKTEEELKENLLEKSISNEKTSIVGLAVNEEPIQSNNKIETSSNDETKSTEIAQIVTEILANLSENDNTEIMVESNSNQTGDEITGAVNNIEIEKTTNETKSEKPLEEQLKEDASKANAKLLEETISNVVNEIADKLERENSEKSDDEVVGALNEILDNIPDVSTEEKKVEISEKEKSSDNLSEPQQVEKVVSALVNDIIYKAEKIVSPTDSVSSQEQEMNRVTLINDSLEKILADEHGISVVDNDSTNSELIMKENIKELHSIDLEGKLDVKAN